MTSRSNALGAALRRVSDARPKATRLILAGLAVRPPGIARVPIRVSPASHTTTTTRAAPAEICSLHRGAFHQERALRLNADAGDERVHARTDKGEAGNEHEDRASPRLLHTDQEPGEEKRDEHAGTIKSPDCQGSSNLPRHRSPTTFIFSPDDDLRRPAHLIGQRPIRQRLGEMHAADRVAAVEIGERARNRSTR